MTHLPGMLLDEPAPRGARLLALGFLRDAAGARARMDGGGAPDAEALHDFRVALRRLRATLREYRRVLRDGVRGRDRRRVARLLESTGAARDAQVHAAALAAMRATLGDEARAGADGLLRRLEEDAPGAAPGPAKRFRRVRRRLERRLGTLCMPVEADPAGIPPLSALLADRTAAAAGALGRALARAGEEVDPVAVHRARLAVKRLRYLVEPFAEALDGGAELLGRLRALQDEMGALNDGWLLAARVAQAREPEGAEHPAEGDAGLGALAGHLAAGHRLRAEALRGRCAPGPVGELLALAARAAASARSRSARNVEIERKYLLKGFPTLPAGAESVEIWQGWIPGRELNERIRRVRAPDGAERWFRTVKLGTGVQRTEVEEEAPAPLARRLWLLTRGRRVRKRRWSVPHGGLTWEIDRFAGRALVLAEVELPSATHPVEVPEWLLPWMDREVTGDPRFVNLNLAR